MDNATNNTTIISVKNLTKEFKIYHKQPGLLGSLKSLVTRKYETKTAVESINFEVKQGELVGFIGPNGAGKTTTLKMLSGLLYPTSGELSVLGFTPWQRKEAFQKQFSLVMGQKNQLWWDLPAMESFLLNKAIYEIPDEQFKKTLEKLTSLLDVKDVLDVQVRKLSLGQRMKCELIAALLHNPKVLFLDEPTIGLDVVMQKVMRDFIRDYNREFQATILLTSHYMDDVKELCKRVIIIDKGKVLFDGNMQDIINKYAVNKIISLTLSQHAKKEALETVGTVKSYEYPDVQLLVPRKYAAQKAAQLLREFPVEDLNIEEPPIEAIIRDVFKHSSITQ